MENYILVDGKRIESLVGFFNSTFVKDGDTITWYTKRDCGYKFLVINDRLVIGAIKNHDALYAAWTLRDESPTNDIKKRAEAIASEQWNSHNWVVMGAGQIGIDGQITGWKSECFRVETPIDMRSKIEKEVEQLFRSGALIPR